MIWFHSSASFYSWFSTSIHESLNHGCKRRKNVGSSSSSNVLLSNCILDRKWPISKTVCSLYWLMIISFVSLYLFFFFFSAVDTFQKNAHYFLCFQWKLFMQYNLLSSLSHRNQQKKPASDKLTTKLCHTSKIVHLFREYEYTILFSFVNTFSQKYI